MMTEEEFRMAGEALAAARRLAGSEAVMVRRAGERMELILTDLFYEHDPVGWIQSEISHPSAKQEP